MGRWPMLSYPLLPSDQGAAAGVHSDVSPGDRRRWNLVVRAASSVPAQALWVTGNFFPRSACNAAGRPRLRSARRREGAAAPGAVLGYAFWQRESGGIHPRSGSRSCSTATVRHRRRRVARVQRRGRRPRLRRRACRSAPNRSSAARAPRLARPDVWLLGGIGRLKPGVDGRAGGRAARGALEGHPRGDGLAARYTAQDAKDYLEMELVRAPGGGRRVRPAPATTATR